MAPPEAEGMRQIAGTPKGVSAKINAEDPTVLEVYSLSGKSASVNVKLTYPGEVTKTAIVKVKAKKQAVKFLGFFSERG